MQAKWNLLLLALFIVVLIIIGLFLFITGPTATHAVANAALVSGLLPLGVKNPQEVADKTSAVKAGSTKRSHKKKVRKS